MEEIYNKKIYHGRFFLENQEKDFYYGVLEIKNDQIELSLNTPLKIGFDDCLTIFGFLDDGNKITLEYCSLKSEKFSSLFKSQKISVLNCYIGEIINNLEDNIIVGMRIETSLLKSWANMFIFDDKKNEDSFDFSYKLQKPIISELEFFSVTLNFDISMSYPSNSSFNFEQTPAFYINFREKVSVEKAWKIAFKINQLMTILIGEKTEIIEIKFFLKKLDEEIVETKYHKIIYETPLIPYGSIWKSETKNKEKHWRFMSSNLREIEIQLPDIIKTWFSKEDKIDVLINLFTSVYLLDGQFTETQFLTLAQALESFHRKNRKNYMLDENEFAEKRKKIIEALPEEYKEEFEGRLKFTNEPNFSKRIKELFNEANDIIGNKKRDIKSISNEISEMRNYYTHYDKSNKNHNSNNFDKLIEYTDLMEILVYIILFKEIGFDNDKIKKIFNKKINNKD